MPIGEPSEDDLYLAKLTTDEVGEPTQDPFTAKGQLANALDEAVFNPDNPVSGENIPEEKDPRGETDGELEGIEQGNTPDTPTMDTKPKSAKNSLAEAFNSVFSMDERVEDQKPTIVPPQYDGRKRSGDDDDNDNQKNEIGDADTPADNADRMWLKKKYESVKPELPPSLGGKPKTDENGLVYLEYTFTIDPEKYESNNYHPIPKGADAKQVGTGTLLKKKDLEERARQAENPEASEEMEVAEAQEKKTTDEAPEKAVLDYASALDGSSFMCYDEVDGIDYTQIAMDASPKKAIPKPNCKTTFAQCRAKNPLYCRFHGPKLLEKDIKQALTALLGKNNCVISVTKDQDAPTPMTFRLTVGCTPAMKDKVEDMVHKFLTQNPGIKSKEDWKDLGYDKGKIMETEEFEMDVLQADKPPKSSDWAQQAKYDTEKAKAEGKKQAVVGETPSKIEAIAKGEKPPMEDKTQKKGPEDVDGGLSDQKAQLESEFNEVLGGYPEDGTTADDDAKNIEISNAFQKAYGEGDVDGMKSAIGSLKELVEKAGAGDSAASGDEGLGFKKTDKGNDSQPQGKAEGEEYNAIYDTAAKETEALMQDYTSKYFDNEDCMFAAQDLKSALHNLQNLKGNIEAIQKSLDNLGSFGQLTASDVVAKETLSNSLKKFKDSWPEAKKHYDSMKKALEDSIEAAKGIDIDKVKAGAAEKVEGVVKSIARQMFPNGKTEGVESVAQLFDYKIDSVKKLAKGWDKEQISEMMDMNGLTNAYKKATAAANDFDMAVSDFKEAMDGLVEDKDKSTEKTVTDPKYVKDIVETAAEEVVKKGQALVEAMTEYDWSLGGTKEKIELSNDMNKMGKVDAAETKKQKKESSEPQEAQPTSIAEQPKSSAASVPKKTVYTKEMLAAMSPKEKFTKGLAVIKKKLAQDPDNANLKALQAKVEKQLAALQ